MAVQLRTEIRRGILEPGARLRQGEVAARLGVSTTPVREAFRVLHAEGLLRTDPHRDTVVFRPTIADVKEAYEIRETLEPLALERAIENADPSLIEELDQILHEMDHTEDEARWVELNHEFHSRMYNASNRPLLASILMNISGSSVAYMHMVVPYARASGRAQSEHREILNALEKKDVERAKKAIVIHLHHTVEHMVSYLEEMEAKRPSRGAS